MPKLRGGGSSYLREVELAAKRRMDALAEFHEAIYAASMAGHTNREIAASASLSHQRVGQIVAERRKAHEPDE